MTGFELFKLQSLIHIIISVHFCSSYVVSTKFCVQSVWDFFFLLPSARERNDTSVIGIILPHLFLTKYSPPLEILDLLRTTEECLISLEWWFQPHRRHLFPYVLCLSLFFFFFLLICKYFYYSLVSTPPTLRFSTVII